MKVLLLNPPPHDRSWYRVEHLGIAYLAAVLRRQGREVHLLDSFLEDLDVEQTVQAIISRCSDVDLIGITATEPNTWQAGIDVARQLRSDGLSFHLTAGGYLPTFWYEELLTRYPEVDSVVIGEGEATLAELVEALVQHRTLKQVPGLVVRDRTGAPLVTPRRELIRNLDDLPFPARDYLAVAHDKYHHAVISGSRGCYHKCSFCQIAQFYRLSSGVPYRTRSARNIADEIELLVNEHGVRSIFFVDDEFISESKRRRNVIEELIEEIRRRDLRFSFSIQYRADTGTDERLLAALKGVGLSTVFIGVESGVDSVLERFDKGINKADITRALRIVHDLDLNLIAGYMLYTPETTFEELKQSVLYLCLPEAPIIQDLHGMNLLKGTIEERKLRQDGLVLDRGLRTSYEVQDKRVVAFIDLVRHYFPIYRSVVLDLYELLFMMVQLPATLQIEKKRIDHSIRDLHIEFMTQAIDRLSQDELDESVLLDEMREKFNALSVDMRRLLLEGRAAARNGRYQA